MMGQQIPFVITIVGAESSGKTTLARQLAEYYGCPWVMEYAREYLVSLGRAYHEQDLHIIAERQWERISAVASLQSAVGSQQSSVDSLHSSVISRPPVFGSFSPISIETMDRPVLVIDGGMLTLRMWARIKYGISIPIVEEAMREDLTSLYILCRPVFAWEPDPLRESPSLLERVWIYNQYLKELIERKSPIQIVTG